jgi:nuclear pore complex protein Nup98-Nup96
MPVPARASPGTAAKIGGSVGLPAEAEPEVDDNAAPLLTRPKYYTIPSISKLRKMSGQDLSQVEDFVVGHDDFGEILWPGYTDVRGLCLDDIVIFKEAELEVYPNPALKPQTGLGLNKPAIITLKRCWPPDPNTKIKGPSPDQELMARYERKLKKCCAKTGAKFEFYHPQEGEWQFAVQSF